MSAGGAPPSPADNTASGARTGWATGAGRFYSDVTFLSECAPGG
jgi:hypothetical protein